MMDTENEPTIGKIRKSDAYYKSEPIEKTIKKMVQEIINKHSQR